MRPVLWTFKIVLWLVVLLLIVVFFILPILTSVLVNNAELLTPTNLKKYLEFADFIQIWTMRFFIVTWCFFLGSCLASFLNVVAWRLLKNPNQLPMRNPSNGKYYASWHDGKILRVIQTDHKQETWTQYDPETYERQFLPKSNRSDLLRLDLQK